MTQQLPPKKEVALALLERSNVDVYLDPRARGVVVPPQFRKEPRLILKIGLNMPVPIPDLRVDEESMSCTLSFNRAPFYCVVPWSSVFAMVGEDGRGMVWPDDVPHELAVKVIDDKRSPPDRESAPSRSDSPSSRRGGRPSKLAEDAPRDSSARDSSSSSSSRAQGAGGKKRKKKDEGRPVLVSVPRAAPSSPASARPSLVAEGGRGSSGSGGGRDRRPSSPETSERSERRDGAMGAESSAPDASPQSSRSSGDDASQSSRAPRSPRMPVPRTPVPPPLRRPDGVRPKRELPPYLRVVK